MDSLSWFACPRCLGPLEFRKPDTLFCPLDAAEYKRVDGIWRFLLPERESYYAAFINDYERIRHGESRGDDSPNYYSALPERDLTGRRTAEWRIRAASYRLLVRKILAPMEARCQRSLNIIDMGSGNGWLSNRLAQRGHWVAAIDLTVNDFDGLGCHRYYESVFSPVQAEFDVLPFCSASADLVIFNASLHYSEDYERTLLQSLRILLPGGMLVILDSPVYHSSASGEKMVQEREISFLHEYGLRSDALDSQNYLTYSGVRSMGEKLHIRWRIITPNYGLRWFLRPAFAALRGRREPAKFHILAGNSF